MLNGEDRVVDIGYAAGFESESVFHRQFLALTRMTPGAYRALKGANVFLLQLPAGYRAQEILAYHNRDPAKPVRARRGWAHLQGAADAGWSGGAGDFAGAAGRLVPRSSRTASWGATARGFVHAAALRMLGLTADVTAFETRAGREARMARLFARRKGLRLPLTPTGFDGLCWAVIGQQINVPFAAALRREMLELAGEKVGDMRAHPSPERVANLDVADLTKRRYSRSKAEYLIGAAQAVVEGDIARRDHGGWLGGGGRTRAHQGARHRHLDGALHADARRGLCRLRAGGRCGAGRRIAETAR